jgi:hypothetical protein
MASELIPSWVVKMREAAASSITEGDIKDIVKAQVQRAKDGNAAALKFIFEQVLGGAELKGATFIQNNYGKDESPEKPALALPGSNEKIELMRRRVTSGNGAFVNGDGVNGDLD